MLFTSNHPFTYGSYPEDREDSDSNLTPSCAICEGPVDAKGWCEDCEEQNDA